MLQEPNGIIAPYWDDLNPATGGQIYTGTVGSFPNRRFVVSWAGVPRTSTPLTFQAILEEATGEIIFQYLEVQSETSRGGGKQATVGLEDPSGALGVLCLQDGAPRLLQDRSAIRFRPREWRTAPWAMVEGGLFKARFALPDGNYSLESSENLIEWTAVPGATLDSRQFTTEIAPSGARFFRARRID